MRKLVLAMMIIAAMASCKSRSQRLAEEEGTKVVIMDSVRLGYTYKIKVLKDGTVAHVKSNYYYEENDTILVKPSQIKY